MLLAREIFREALQLGDSGTFQTLSRMRSLVASSTTLPEARLAVVQVLQDTQPRDPHSELQALLEWVQSHWHYTRDPTEVELVQTPRLMLQTIQERGEVQGDCDDAAVLYATLAESAGYPTRFVVQGMPGETFSHVVVEVQAKGAWIKVDPSQSTHGVGWAPTLGREATDMLTRSRIRTGLGQDDLAFLDPGAGATEVQAILSAAGSWDGSGGSLISDILTPGGGNVVPSATTTPPPSSSPGIFSQVTGLLQSVLPVAERYGVVRPIVGYNANGTPIYAAATLPVGGTSGALFQQLGTPILFGLTGMQLLLIGGAAYLMLKR